MRLFISGVFVWLSNIFIVATNCGLGVVRGQTIKELSVDQVRDRDASTVLVDVRSPREIDVSRIPGAITKSQFESNKQRYQGKTIVTYCTVGGRSLLAARRLAAEGFEVRNFRASMLGWCTAGLPLVDGDGNETQAVHLHSPMFYVDAPYRTVS
jgi:rhodanese-related sulfurtransferase